MQYSLSPSPWTLHRSNSQHQIRGSNRYEKKLRLQNMYHTFDSISNYLLFPHPKCDVALPNLFSISKLTRTSMVQTRLFLYPKPFSVQARLGRGASFGKSTSASIIHAEHALEGSLPSLRAVPTLKGRLRRHKSKTNESKIQEKRN